MARARDVFGGVDGVGLALSAGLPGLPARIQAAGEYFFPECPGADGCGFSGGSADVHLLLPLPFLRPYGTAGLVWRRHGPGGEAASLTHAGFGGGAGLELDTPFADAWAEARWEVSDPDDQLVLRVGLRF